MGMDERLDELLRRIGPQLERIMAGYYIPPEDAEDLVQDVMLQFLRKRPTILSPEAWFKGAIRNQCRMYWRTRSRRLTQAMDDAFLERIAGGSKEDPERAMMRRDLGRWVSKLPANCRSLLNNRYGLDLDVRETADRTGYRPSSVDKVTRRCLDKLTRMIASLPARSRKKPTAGAQSPSEPAPGTPSRRKASPGTASPSRLRPSAQSPSAQSPSNTARPSRPRPGRLRPSTRSRKERP